MSSSLDGYSLNEKINNLRDDIFKELIQMREDFTELYSYISKLENPKKEKKNAKPKKVRSEVQEG